MFHKFILSLFFLLTSLAVVSSPLHAEPTDTMKEQPATVSLTPSSIDISAFYNGSDVNVQGNIPAADEILIRLSGSPHEVSG